jgi:NADH-quinone oxidoreductase subunit M
MNCNNIVVTFPELLIWFPLVAGLIAFMLRNPATAKAWALLASIVTLCISLTSLLYITEGETNFCLNNVSYVWLQYIGSSFALGLDGTGWILTLLTAVAFPLIFAATYKNHYKNTGAFYGLMLLTQAGLMGVFTATDALVFYFFWEMALIPAYFLCSRWGGERRIQATFKFFVYTFAGSLLMLAGILYVYQHTGMAVGGHSAHSFALRDFQNVQLTSGQQGWLFWLFFVAFAIKMPIFPFHTWQPDAYEQSPTATTMVLSGIMVKMGLFAVIRWLIPVFPQATAQFDQIVIGLSVIGMLYASCIAMVQDDLKRLAAYSSIAHIGLMCAALFSAESVAIQGVMIQMFSHGVNIIGLWIVIDIIEKQTGIRKMSQLGGLAHRAPVLATMLVIIALANIALPLTNAFIGEFMMFSGLFKYNVWITAVAGISIILAAIYTLNMIQKVFLGTMGPVAEKTTDIGWQQRIVLAIIVVLIFMMGLFPQPIFDLTKGAVGDLISNIKRG